MSDTPARLRVLSGGPLEGTADRVGTEGSACFDVTERERYDDAGRLGRGGMGEVRVAVDQRLDREVALKTSLAHDAETEARMVREAMLAAHLEHPGIVPVYGAGRLPDGRLYYTMRVVRGRSLQDALADTTTLASRLRLVRRVLDAAEAVAYAHDRGVLHRDLKPANVMLAEHGETVVVDWGLATMLSPAPPVDGTSVPGHSSEPPATPLSSETGTDPGGADLTLPGDVFGTPAYMAPEQARGEQVGKRADVFALGGMLFHLLTGHPPRECDATAGPTEPVRARHPEVPAELAAIADRALSDDATARYPDAGALAADLAAWLDGRPVTAHDYSLVELLARLVRAHRLAITVALIATIGIVVAIVVGMQRTIAERNRARAAETEAVQARESSDANLARALVAQAIVAADRGDRARAELLAAHALRFGEDPRARGLLARSAGRPRATRVHVGPPLDCLDVEVDTRGERVACLRDDEVLVLVPDRGPTPLARRPIRAWSAAFGGDLPWLAMLDEEGILGWDLATNRIDRLPGPSLDSELRTTAIPGVALRFARGRAHVVDADGHPEALGPECPGRTRPLRSVMLPGARVFYACAGRGSADSTIVRIEADGTHEQLLSIPVGDGPPSALDVDPDDPQRVVVGTEDGLVTLYERGRVLVLRRPEGGPGVRELALSGSRIAIAGSQGGVQVLDLEAPQWSTSLPAGPATVRWIEDGQVLRVVSDEVTDWEVPAVLWPHRLELGSGLSAVALSPDGETIGSTHGDGTLRLHERRTGALRFRHSLQGGVAKDLAFSPDGRFVAAGTAQGLEVVVFDVESGARVRSIPTKKTRRLAWDATQLFVVPSAYALTSWDSVGTRRDWAVDLQVDDLERIVDGPGVVIVENRSFVRRLDPAVGLHADTPRAEVTNAHAVASSRNRTYVAAGHMVVTFDAELRELDRLRTPGAEIEEVALSPDARWLAVGHRDGAVGLWRTEDWQPIARLEGHTGRVPALAFTPRGDGLVSGSWDGTIRTWDLGVMEITAADFIETAQAAWGMDLAAALQR
ncbi:MAG: serine/threonine-protein kinase [Myxococcota bacterium]